jgi:undecaprenyl pyrophosphate phosphatase UppP
MGEGAGWNHSWTVTFAVLAVAGFGFWALVGCSALVRPHTQRRRRIAWVAVAGTVCVLVAAVVFGAIGALVYSEDVVVSMLTLVVGLAIILAYAVPRLRRG